MRIKLVAVIACAVLLAGCEDRQCDWRDEGWVRHIPTESQQCARECALAVARGETDGAETRFSLCLQTCPGVTVVWGCPEK